MHTVKIRCGQGDDIGARLMELRVWLDSNKCETSRFVYARQGGDALITLDFRLPEQANLFAAAFDGRMMNGTVSLAALES